MGRKRNRNNLEKRGGSADDPRPGRGGPGENWGDDGGARTAPAPLIAVHPTGDLVAVAFGAIVRVYDLKRDRPARLVSEHPADAHAAPPSSAEAPAASPPAAADDDEAKKIAAKKMSSSSDDRDRDPRWHAEAVRALRFDPTGRFMLTAGDDKLARVWRVHHNVAFDERSVPGDPATVASGARATLPKKLSAATFTDDGERAFFADKFGDVFVLPTDKPTLDARRRRRREAEGGERGGNDAAKKKKKKNGDAGASGEGEAEDAEEKTQTGRQSLSSDDDVASYALGHCCSIVTDACVPPGSSLLCTADRDNKVRITHVPRGGPSAGGGDVLDVGAPEILSFCRGHASHVACCVGVPGRGDRLVTGGGDGTVRLWRVHDGEELAEVKVAEPYAEKEPDEEEEGGEEGEDNSEKDDAKDAAKAAAGGPPSASGGYKHRDHRAPFAPAVFALAVHGSEVYACVEGEGMRLVARVDGEGADALVATSDEREGAGAEADADADAPRRVATSLACGGGRLWAVGARNDEEGASGGDGAGATAVVFEVVGGAEDGIGRRNAAANERCAAALAIRGPRVERVGADADVRKATYDAREREGRKKGRRDKTAFSASARAYEAERKERGG